MTMNTDNRFQTFLSEQDYSPQTVRAFSSDFKKFVQWFATANDEAYSDERVTIRDVVDFRDWLRRDRKQATATVNRSLATLRRYFRWATSRGCLLSNPVDGVKDLKAVRQPPRSLERPQIRKILRILSLRGKARDEALVGLMLFCGMRVGEVISLTLEDIILGERSGQVTIRDGKGSKERTVPLGIHARKPLTRWLDERPRVETDRVFLGRDGKPLGTDGIRHLCQSLGTAAGVHLYPHALRHSFAVNWLSQNENDLVGLAQLMGHSDVNTSARYAQRMQAELQESVESLSY